MASGADAALTKHLTFLVYHTQNTAEQRGKRTTSTPTTAEATHDDSIRLELSLTCDAMESLFRASSSVVGVSFKRLGCELMQLIVTIIDVELRRRQVQLAAATIDHALGQDEDQGGVRGFTTRQREEGNQAAATRDNVSRYITPPVLVAESKMTEGDLLLRKATKLLGHFARVGEATEPMAHFPGVLGSLVELISLSPFQYAPWEARLSALWTVANLACNAENMQMMACTPGLVSSLVEVASRPLHATDSLEKTIEVLRSRSIASRAILNLSWSPENKICLSENAALIDLLAELIVLRSAVVWSLNRSGTIQEILDTTRRHAAGALRNLAAAPRRIKVGLCNYKNGHLLDVLTDAALNDPDVPVKDRAFATIHNLAIYDTAEKIVSHPALVLALKDVLLSADDDDDDDRHIDGTPKQHASATLLVLERTITPSMDSYENLRALLDALHPTNNSAGASDDGEAVAV